MRFPVVDRIPPELSLSAEVVGRNSCQKARPALLVQKKKLRVCPHVARIERDKKGQVADEPHTFGAGIFLEPLTLAMEQELRQANLIDLVSQYFPSLCERGRFTSDKF